jgi:hypothetical protein
MAAINVGLNGNHQLTAYMVILKVANSAGAYALGKTLHTDGSMPVSYVGRSDDDLCARLLQHAGENKYSYFAFIHCANAVAAYQKECELYHTFANLDNKVHPAKPNTSCKCLKCGA